MIFIGSDFHFSHANVISYCNRPWKTVDEMNEAMVKIWNETVGPEDTIYVVGDFSLSPKAVETYLPRLNGEKHLILGNHDAPFPKKLGAKQQKTENMRNRYFAAGFKTLTLDRFLKLGEHEVHLCHFPFAGNTSDKRYLDHRPENVGQILLSGHSHAYYRKLGKNIDVGFDGDLKIWSEKEIIELIEDPRDYIPSPLTEFYRNRKNNNEE